MFAALDELPKGWCEVCVVGAGPVGLALAISLASRGVRIVVVETGDTRRKKRAQDVARLASFDACYHSHSDETVVRAVGGSSLRWGGRCVEFDDIDFMKREHLPGCEWPISHDDVKPYYEQARRILTADAGRADIPALDPAFNLSQESWARIRNAAQANMATLARFPTLRIVRNCTAVGLQLDELTGRLKALECVERKRRRFVEATYFVCAGGGRENARLLLEAQRSMPRLFGGIGGPLGRFYMGHLTGEIAAIRFDDAFSAEAFQFKMSPNGTVFRNRLQPSATSQKRHHTLNIALWPDGLRPDEVIKGHGAASLFHVARHLFKRAGHPVFDHSISPKSVMYAHAGNIVSHPLQTLSESTRIVARKMLSPGRMPQFALFSPTNTYLLRYHAEHLPQAQSRVTLSEERDENGCRRLDVDFRYCAEDFDSVVRSHELLATWLRLRHAGSIQYLRPQGDLAAWVSGQAVDGYHQIGLTRMSSSRPAGIVDATCRTHDVSNLYMAGSSVFPTSGQANPTLPAVALALRLADHLLERLTRDKRHVNLVTDMAT